MKAQLVAELKLRGKNGQPEVWLFYVVNDHGTFDMRYENVAEGVQLDPLRLQPCSFHGSRREAIAAAAARLADIEQLADLLCEL